MNLKYEIDDTVFTDYENLAETEIIPKIKTIEEIAQDMALKAHIRWEEIQVEKATTEQLLKAKETIEKELKKRDLI